MKKLMQWLVAALVLIASNSSFAQTKEEKREIKENRKQERKLQKAERKNEEAIRLKENYELIVSQIKDSSFVIETNTLFDRYNNSYQVSPNTNFVMVNGDEFTMQLGFNGRIGVNGLGGVTLEGNITRYEILEAKENGPARIRLTVNSLLLGSTEVGVTVSRDGTSRAYVSGAFRTRLSFAGEFSPLEESIVYKGIVTY
ncbi:DUF4251 domain-containing protein [Fulvivirgaceae bacterium BMA12]|uniref:DUF4251 domain-containing protein n=1 Tax=Agaribacillus aureus TaxID=3051825 RepID=A0ABT8L0V7_9BACT|nr:DUF4251 domain-containing protein [Fulvivirgaceae bacterium BMA12]